MKEMNREQRQIEREQRSKQNAEDLYLEEAKKKEDLVNASNTDYALDIKRKYLGDMIKRLTKEINKYRREGRGSAGKKRIQILNRCLGVKFRSNTNEIDFLNDTDKHGLFNPEVACHIALQLTLDAALLPNKPFTGKSSTNSWRMKKPSIRLIQSKIGEEIWRQMHYNLINKNFSKWFANEVTKASNDEGARSSAHYAHRDLDKAIEGFKEWMLSKGNLSAVELLTFDRWSYEEQAVVGSWLLSLTYDTGLFKKVASMAHTREETIELSANGEAIREAVTEAITSYVFEPLPMVCEPRPMTKHRLGGWIEDGMVLNAPIQSGRKGWIELSDKHVDFYNKQQNVPFRVNQFVWSVVKELKERNEQLASWKYFTSQQIQPLWQRIGINGFVWDNATKQEQDALLNRDPALKKAKKRELSKEYAARENKLKEGKTTECLHKIVEQCEHEEKIWIPIKPDFRSRYTCRTSFLSYQSTDSGRALLEFAEPYQISSDDNDAKKHLAIHLANCIGLDKKSNSTRINWVEKNLQKIKAIANILNNWDEGFQILKSFEKDDPFQFLAACKEYTDLYIDCTREHTHLPIAVDATCSGQQLIAGFLRDGELAERVNVLPTNQPGDIYRDCMDKMLELIADDDNGSKFRRSTLKAFKGSIGRKASKKGFMSGQYGSGKDRQLEDIFNYLEDEIKLNDDEKKLIKTHWPTALEEVCKIRVVFNWFSDLVQEIHASGKDEVLIPTATGSIIHQTYPIPKYKQIRTFAFGSSQFKEARTNKEEPTDKRNLGKWKTATAANCIHGAGDAALLCMALGEFDHSFYAVHDSISTYIGKPMKDLQKRLRKAYREVVEFDLWNEIRAANGLPTGAKYNPALVNTLDLDLVEKSEYMFC